MPKAGSHVGKHMFVGMLDKRRAEQSGDRKVNKVCIAILTLLVSQSPHSLDLTSPHTVGDRNIATNLQSAPWHFQLMVNPAPPNCNEQIFLYLLAASIEIGGAGVTDIVCFVSIVLQHMCHLP